jgi:membrane protein DedA with SNARE-associated domain
LEHFLTTTVGSHGYLAVFVLMALSCMFLPIPTEIVMVFGGALAASDFTAGSGNRLDLVAVSLVGVAGTLAGSWAAYAAGFAGGRPAVERWGRFVLLRPHHLDRAHAWFERHGEAAVFWGRNVPVIRAFISLPAGVARMPPVRFTVFTALGSLPWCFGLATAGYLLGDSWHKVDDYVRPVSIAIGAMLVAWLALWFVRRSRARRHAPGA